MLDASGPVAPVVGGRLACEMLGQLELLPRNLEALPAFDDRARQHRRDRVGQGHDEQVRVGVGVDQLVHVAEDRVVFVGEQDSIAGFIGLDGKIERRGMLLKQDKHRLERKVDFLHRELEKIRRENRKIIEAAYNVPLTVPFSDQNSTWEGCCCQ